MNHKELVTGHRSKHYKSQFIFKLVDIMKNFPKLVRWTENGQSIQLLEISQIQKNILPHYFRHSKFQSFIRQLHLYNFKQKKQFKNQLIFEHSSFKRGNQSQFTLIQRTKKKKEKQELLKELENNDLLKSILESKVLTQQQKQILGTMYSYKLVVIQKQRSLKQKMSELIENIKSNRNKKISEIQTVLQDEVKLQIESLKKFSKSIDLFLTETISEKEKQFHSKNQKINKKLYQESENHRNQRQSESGDKNKQQKCGQNRIFPQYTHQKHQAYQSKPFQQVPQNQGYVIQLSGSSISSTENRIYDYQLYFQNPSVNLTVQQQNQNSELQKGVQQQQFIPSTAMNSQNPLAMSIEMFAYQKQPSLLFMPLPFYNRSGASQFFDWPKQQYQEQKQNQVKQEQKRFQEFNKKVLPSPKTKSSQCQIQRKTVKTNDDGREMNQNGEESEISFMNDD